MLEQLIRGTDPAQARAYIAEHKPIISTKFENGELAIKLCIERGIYTLAEALEVFKGKDVSLSGNILAKLITSPEDIQTISAKYEFLKWSTKSLVDKSVNIHTPLITHFMEAGKWEVVDEMVKRGVNLSIYKTDSKTKCNVGLSALEMAIDYGYSLKELLQTNPAQNLNGVLKINFIKTLEDLQMLIDRGKICNHSVEVGGNGVKTVTPLIMHYIKSEQWEFVTQLIESKTTNLLASQQKYNTNGKAISCGDTVLTMLVNSGRYSFEELQGYLDGAIIEQSKVMNLYQANKKFLLDMIKTQKISISTANTPLNNQLSHDDREWSCDILHEAMLLKEDDLLDALLAQNCYHHMLENKADLTRVYVPTLAWAARYCSGYAVSKLLATGKMDILVRETIREDGEFKLGQNAWEILLQSGKYSIEELKGYINWGTLPPSEVMNLYNNYDPSLVLDAVKAGKIDLCGEEDLAVLKSVLAKTNASGEPLLNVNLIYDADGQRLIDRIVAKKDYEMGAVFALRRAGSVEPKEPIVFKVTEKLDLGTNENPLLDTYEPNKVNVVKLVDLMYKKYPLNDGEIDAAIDKFKRKDFCKNPALWSRKVDTISKVIDAIISEMGENMDDRVSKPVNCKKVIATIIHIVEQNPDVIIKHNLYGENSLKTLFKQCLEDLKLCHLGKLINLMSVVQDMIIDNNNQQDYQDEAFHPTYISLMDVLLEKAIAKLGDNAPQAIATWLCHVSVFGIKPEEWNPYTQAMQGIFNEVLIESGKLSSVESYHFSNILDYKTRAFAVEMRNTKWNAGNDRWNEITKIGVEKIAIAFCEKLVRAMNNGESLEDCFGDVLSNPEFAFGDFSVVDVHVFIKQLDHIPNDKIPEFLMSLLDNLVLSDKSNVVISNILFEQMHVNQAAFIEALQEHPSLIETIIDSINDDGNKEAVMQFVLCTPALTKVATLVCQPATLKIVNEYVDEILSEAEMQDFFELAIAEGLIAAKAEVNLALLAELPEFDEVA